MVHIFSVSRKIAIGLDLIYRHLIISVHTIHFVFPLEMWNIHFI